MAVTKLEGNINSIERIGSWDQKELIGPGRETEGEREREPLIYSIKRGLNVQCAEGIKELNG